MFLNIGSEEIKILANNFIKQHKKNFIKNVAIL